MRITETKDGRSLTLRNALPEDAQRLIFVTDGVAQENRYIGRSRFQPNAEEYAEEIEFYDPEVRVVLIAEVGGELVGSIEFNRPKSPKLHHTLGIGMCILDGYRSIGIGAELIGAALAWGRERGVEKAFLSVYHTNDRALGLYRKFGFEECGRYHRQWKIDGEYFDEICMELFL